jgi:hypothetical protein
MAKALAIGLGVGVAVIIILIAVLVPILIKNKKTNNTISTTSSTSTTSTTSTTSSTSTTSTTSTTMQNVDFALKNVVNAFNIKTTAEQFTDIGMRFNNASDMLTNMIQFIRIAFPNIKIDEINKILTDNGLNKTAQQIFDEHKNDNYAEFKSKFNIPLLMSINRFALLTGTDKEIKDKILLYIIVYSAYINIIDPTIVLKNDLFDYITLPYDITLPDSSTATISQIYLTLNNDWNTNDNLTIYTNTNLNSSIGYSNAVEKEVTMDKSCLTTELCKSKISLSGLINMWKSSVAGLENDIYEYVNLMFAVGLFELNGTPITPAMQTKQNYFMDNEVGKLYLLLK